MSAIIGLDFGGTALKAAKIIDRRDIAARITLPGGGHIALKELAELASRCVRDLSSDNATEAVGLCFGGMLQPDGTMREGSTNLGNLDQVPLSEFFSRLLDLPCRVENDAMAAMRGEAMFGAARGLRNALTLTFGSGIGSGILLNGSILRGAHGRAGEIGVWRLAPPGADASSLSFEDLAAPVRFARRTGKDLPELLQRRLYDGEAQALAEPVIEAIGRAIANAHLLLDLQAVILSGGITALGELFLKPVEAAFRAACPAEYHHGLEIRIGSLGPYAGAVGAAALWFEENDA